MARSSGGETEEMAAEVSNVLHYCTSSTLCASYSIIKLNHLHISLHQILLVFCQSVCVSCRSRASL